MAGQTVNTEQVFVVADDAGHLLAGLLMFHGGHSLAYAGSIVFATPTQQGRVARRLLTFVVDWCRARGIRVLGHGAGTVECCQTFLRLGAQITRHHALLELIIQEKEA
jgi:GNAT superfamily N-acetyltransferase